MPTGWRLPWARASTRGAPPDPTILNLVSPKVRAQIGASLDGNPVAVKDLEVAVVEGGDMDLLPVFQDLGSGDLATLLSNADLMANPQDDVIILGSTTGGSLDIVAAPDAATATSLSATMLGVSDDPRLLVPLDPASGASPWHLYQLTSSGPVDLGTLSTSTISPDAPPVATPIPDQVVTPSTLEHRLRDQGHAGAGRRPLFTTSRSRRRSPPARSST